MRPFDRWRAWAVVAALVLSAGCAMRITGTVRDASSGQPVGGAVLSANDGHRRLIVTDPAGGFAVKTKRRPTNLTVSAPGYDTTTIVVPSDNKYPIVEVDLQRSFPLATGQAAPAAAPLVAPVHGAGPGAEAKLQELQQLHDRGVISDGEYKKMRARIVAEY
jgi:hypothetical protein